MPKTFLKAGENTDALGGTNSLTELFGTNEAESVILNGNARAVLDSSFGRGNDTVLILGNASQYTAKLSGSNLVLTAANGANITIGAGTGGTTIKFLDVEGGRTLTIGSSGMFLGNQAITAAGVAVAAGGTIPNGEGGAELLLEVGRDNLTTTAKGVTTDDDTFIADLVQNANGEQTNTLGTGDRLNGLDGVDTLEATVQDASPLNGGPGSSIAPITSSVENIYVMAQQAYDGGNKGDDDESKYGIAMGVEVNAKQMVGVTDFGSIFSDGSLTIYNANTLPSGAAIGDETNARRTGVMTVRMDHTGPASPTDDAADFTVLFDNDYLRADDSVTSGATLNIEMMDLDAAIAIATTKPLLNNPYTSFVFKVGATEIVVPIQASSETYEALLADFQAALAANPVTAGKVTAAFGTAFTANDTDSSPGGSANGKTIKLTNTGSETLTAVQFVAANGVPTDLDFHLQTYNGQPTTVDKLISIEVELDKVGRGGDGGYLTIGGMATVDGHYENSIEANMTSYGAIIEPGIEQFNVHVEGTSAEPSSLAGLQSTHNTLRVVKVDNPNSTAMLTIGNSQTEATSLVNGALGSYDHDDHFIANFFNDVDVSSVRNNAIKDVLIFDASAFTANSVVWAYFSPESEYKYMDMTDTELSGGERLADQARAVYTFAGGANVLNVNFAQDNVAWTGTATREDFQFKASMGGGNDVVQLQIGDGMSAGGESHSYGSNPLFDLDPNFAADWYVNHAINSFDDSRSTVENEWQLSVYTEGGDDSVELWGSTVAHVVLGDGNDVVYTDNSGEDGRLYNDGRSVWVVNNDFDPGLQFDVNDLQSHVPSTNVTKVGNLGLIVTFQGIESHIAVATNTTGINGGTVNDLTINQLIKEAINNDAILSKLLIATDGPGRTLLINSLIDGHNTALDFSFQLVNTGALSTQQTANGVLLFGATALTASLGLLPGGGSGGDRYGSIQASDGSTRLTGYDSVALNNNVVEGGLGNDLFVLSSNGVGGYYNDEGASVETIDINGVFGEDTALNFTAAGLSAGASEVQTITYTGPATADGTVTVELDGYSYTITVDGVAGGANPTTASEIADAVAALINGDINHPHTATSAGGVVTITYGVLGINYGQATSDEAPSVAINEIQTLTFYGSSQLVAGNVLIDLPTGFTDVTVPVGTAGLQTTSEVAAAVAAAINASNGGAIVATVPVGFDYLVVLNYPGTTNHANVIPAISSADVTMNVQVNSAGTGFQDGVAFGLSSTEATITNGVGPYRGWDIFDVTTVIGGSVLSFQNDAPQNGTEPDGATYNEAAALSFTLANARSVAITDTLMGAGDYTLGGTVPATEEGRIQAMVNALDSATSTAAHKSIVITVDHDNRGYFYEISNGTAKNDATAKYLGSVELATFVDAEKVEIGDWDTMSMVNFTPLTAATVVNTFDIA